MESRRTFLKKSTLITAAAFPVLTSCITIRTTKAKIPLNAKKINQVAILWYSQTGNTQKCGKVLAMAFKKKGIKTIYGNLRNFDKINITKNDLIVIGSPVFYYDTPDFVKNFIESLPDLKGIPVAAYVTFGGPEGNQHNAGCSILEGLVEKNGASVGLQAFMSISSYALSFKENGNDLKTKQITILPDQNTYRKVREFAELIKLRIEQGETSEFKRTLTLREFSTYFSPEWWTKQFVDNHFIVEEKCVGCGTCVEKCPNNSIDLENYSVNTNTCAMCFGCINNCEYQAVNMEYNKKKLMGFYEYLKKNNLKFDLPVEPKT